MNDLISPPYGAIEEVIQPLRALLGNRLSLDAEDRQQHGHDVSRHTCQPPQAVVYPRSTEEVAGILKLCHHHRIPVIPYGTATAVEGGVVAVHGGIAVDLKLMNHILRLSVDDADVSVEAGVTRLQLNEYLDSNHSNLMFTVDPGADASLGGMAATRASGSSAVKYGTMRENILGLTGVLADGTVIHTGSRARKSSAGYDLTHLLVGSEGTLAVITEITLNLIPIPEQISAAVCPFHDIESAVAAVLEILRQGVPVARIELLDEIQMDAVNQYSGLQNRVTPTLFFEFHGTPNSVTEQAETAQQICLDRGADRFVWSTDEAERKKLWQARYDSYYACLALRKGSVGYVTDVCVPISQLAECFLKAKEIVRSASLPAPVFGHVGDGNFHVVFPLDPQRPEELVEVTRYHQQLVELALSVGGTCTGEHGIGMGKREALRQEHGVAVTVMQQIKTALDPHHIMNPGKVV